VTLDARIGELLALRTRHTHSYFAAESERIARLCHLMAVRFARGGRLIAVGDSAPARSDMHHIAVEFVHPVIVGKRALPALGLMTETDALAGELALVAAPVDIVVAFGVDGRMGEAVAAAQRRGCLAIAFGTLDIEWRFLPPVDDPFVRQELSETLYHVLWELVHVFFEHRGLLNEVSDDVARTAPESDAGAASFLYPFLANEERDLERVIADVARSAIMKADDIATLRAQTVGDRPDSLGRRALIAAARVLRAAFNGGGTLLAFGNGGSATDAMDAVADYRSPPGSWPRRRALDLSDDAAILTALANDIGPDALFSRQIIAYGRAGDVAMAFSTSGNSRNVIQALGEARRRSLSTIAFVGYDGGRILSEGLADHVVVSPSEYVPRIQEAQAAAHHILRELVELVES
jgi:D-sedoheptulose 7-phosphate isomerase